MNILGALDWQALQPGVDVARLRLAGTGEAWRVGVVLVRLDPSRLTLSLVTRSRSRGGDTRWTIDDAPSNAAVAFNAGQFTDAVPWGWVVRGHREHKPPGRGPLAPAVILAANGPVEIVPPDSIAIARRDTAVRDAFQSYPALLEHDGDIPFALRESGRGVNVTHRDSRLALGTLRDGRVLIALTRFEGLGGALELLPFGLTSPEMAALMGAAGAQRAVMLDGGISGQLLVRDSAGVVSSWSGLRRVPLGLVAVPRGSQ